MPPTVIDLRRSDDARDVIHRAVQALAEGWCVGFPTENEYVVAGCLRHDRAVERLSASAAARVGEPVLAVRDWIHFRLEGVIDWKHHIGHAVAVAKGAEDGITEVYWTDQMVLERRPAADALLTGMGYSGVKYFTPE